MQDQQLAEFAGKRRCVVKRCRHPARDGKLHCKRHYYLDRETRKVKKLPRMYRLVARSLQKRLDELEEQQERRLSLLEEVDLVRASADEAVATYGEARDMQAACELLIEQVRGTPEESKAQQALDRSRSIAFGAGETMRNVLRQVADFVLAAQRAQSLGAGQITPEMVRSVLNQCSLLLYEVCGDENEDLAARFEALVYDRVHVLVTEQVPGPRLNLQLDTRRMLSSVPDCAETA